MAMSKPLDQALTGDKALRAEGGDKVWLERYSPRGRKHHRCTGRLLLLCFPAGVVHPWGERRLDQPLDRPGALPTPVRGADARVSRLGVLDGLS